VTVKENGLTIKGKKADAEQGAVKYLYRGIATRSFERRFELADHIKVTGARLENGILSLDLVREVPEAMKPRSIKIGGTRAPRPKVIESSAA
jgi:molecular chaperone IbpA